MRLHLHGGLESYDSPRAVLFKTAQRLALNQIRARRGNPLDRAGELFDETALSHVPAASAEDGLIAREQAVAYKTALASLPRSCRQVFELRTVQRLSYREMSQTLGLSVSTLEKHMERGKRVCAQSLAAAGHASTSHAPPRARQGRSLTRWRPDEAEKSRICFDLSTPPEEAAITYFPQIRSLGDAPRFHGALTPDKPVFLFEGRLTTWAQFDRHTAQVANGLLAQGVRPGSRVAYLGKNSDHFFEIFFGAARMGAVLTPVNWRLAEPEVSYITNDAEARVLFVDAHCAALARRIEGQIATVGKIIAMEEATGDWEGFDAWRDRQSAADQTVEIAPSDVAIQLYTSGTTGRPKGVQLLHRNFYAWGELAAADPRVAPEMSWNEWSADDVSLVAMPVFHISGSGWGILSVYSGAFTVVLREFDNAAVIGAIRDFKVSKTVLVPTTIQTILDYPGLDPSDFSSITDFLYGASPIPLDVLERAVRAFGCAFIQLYGMTETCGAVTFLPAADHVLGNPRLRSAGKAIPGAEIRILAAESEGDLPTGTVGEICIRSPSTMLGYWKQDAETSRVIGADGWVRSGDAGYLDADGYLFICDRVKDMIVSGGENVYPAEVENAIYGHPDVAEAAVIGVPDPKWGEAVKAVVVLKAGHAPDAQSILDYARQRIAGYKTPKSVDFVRSLPRNATGKVLKRDLRAPYWAGHDRQVN